ncbi:hypothetical protein HOY80DRAFT_418621 [Tuber brumale]|nr:hypothetical protein HOY80DRAFT_418621 [Tuber brumale]
MIHHIFLLHFFAFLLFPTLQCIPLPVPLEPNSEPSFPLSPPPRFTRMRRPRAPSPTTGAYFTPPLPSPTYIIRGSSAARGDPDQNVPSLSTIIVLIILIVAGLCLSVLALVACGYKLYVRLSRYISRRRERKDNPLAAIRVGESAGETGPCSMVLDLERGDMESVREIDREMSTAGSRSVTAEAENASTSSTGWVTTTGERGTVRRVKVPSRDSVLPR